MILPAKTARAIAAGRVTTLLIPAKPGRAGARFAGCPWKLGREYSIPAPLTARDRAQIANGDKPMPKPLGNVRVTSIGQRVETMPDRTPVSIPHERPVSLALATDDEKCAWVREHDAKWLDKHAADIQWAKAYDCWATRWARDQRHAESYILLARYHQRWEGRPVWIVRFELVADLRYLAQPDPVKGQGDYTRARSRAIDELPVVDEATQERYAKRAEETRQSFKRDLEQGRAEQRKKRLAMFREAA